MALLFDFDRIHASALLLKWKAFIVVNCQTDSAVFLPAGTQKEGSREEAFSAIFPWRERDKKHGPNLHSSLFQHQTRRMSPSWHGSLARSSAPPPHAIPRNNWWTRSQPLRARGKSNLLAARTPQGLLTVGVPPGKGNNHVVQDVAIVYRESRDALSGGG